MSALVTIDAARLHAQLADVPAARLEQLLAAASAWAEKYCHRIFASTEHVERHNGDNGRELILNNLPVTELSALTIGDVLYDDASEPLLADTFDHDPATGRLWFGLGASGVFPRGVKNITVTYEAGFDPIPADVQEAVIERAAELNAEANTAGNLSSEQLGDYAAGYADRNAATNVNGSAKVRGLLGPYVLYSNAVIT